MKENVAIRKAMIMKRLLKNGVEPGIPDERQGTAKTGRRRNKAYGSIQPDAILPTLWQADEYESQIGLDIC